MLSLIYYIVKGLKKTVGSKTIKNILFKLAKERFFFTEKIFSPDTQKTINRLTILLPGKGCWWAKQKNGGCTMCGFKEKLKEIRSNRYSAWDIIFLFKIALELTDENYSEIAFGMLNPTLPNGPEQSSFYHGRGWRPTGTRGGRNGVRDEWHCRL